MQLGLKNVTIPASVKVIESIVIDTCRVGAVTVGAASSLTIKAPFVTNSLSPGIVLRDYSFDLDIPSDYNNAIVDLSALAFVPTFVPESEGGLANVFAAAKEIRVKQSLVARWKNLSTLDNDTKNKIIGV